MIPSSSNPQGWDLVGGCEPLAPVVVRLGPLHLPTSINRPTPRDIYSPWRRNEAIVEVEEGTRSAPCTVGQSRLQVAASHLKGSGSTYRLQSMWRWPFDPYQANDDGVGGWTVVVVVAAGGTRTLRSMRVRPVGASPPAYGGEGPAPTRL